MTGTPPSNAAAAKATEVAVDLMGDAVKKILQPSVIDHLAERFLATDEQKKFSQEVRTSLEKIIRSQAKKAESEADDVQLAQAEKAKRVEFNGQMDRQRRTNRETAKFAYDMAPVESQRARDRLINSAADFIDATKAAITPEFLIQNPQLFEVIFSQSMTSMSDAIKLTNEPIISAPYRVIEDEGESDGNDAEGTK